LDPIERLRAADFDFAHVADVKKPGGGARGEVFADDSGILDGHVPTAKIDHFGAHTAMRGVERGLAKLRCGRFDHKKFQFRRVNAN